MSKTARKPRAAQASATDRVEVAGGAACPRCGQPMQRFERPAGYKPNAAPFAFVTLWDRCRCGASAGADE
jgi:hypothetical protein